MCRPVLSYTDGVVSEDVNDGDLHDCTEPNGGARIIAEDQELRTVRPYLGERQAVNNGMHRMFADAEVKVAPSIVLRFEIAGVVEGQSSFCGRCQIS